MWTKSISFINNVHWLEKRLIRHIQSASNESYLFNPGSEPLTNATLGEVLASTAHKYPGRVAVRSVHEDITITYEQLLNQADSLGCALRAQGLQKGDRLGIWSHNTASWLIALVAAARVGLISVLMNPSYEKPELSFAIKKAGIKSLIIPNNLPNRDYYGKLTELIPELRTSTSGSFSTKTYPDLISIVNSGKEKMPGTVDFDTLITHNKTNLSKYCQEVQAKDGVIIHFTSGTTGDPKAPLDSHYGVVNNTYFIGKRNTFHEYHHKICVQVPLFHALGSVVTVLSGLRHGSTLVLTAPIYNVSANINTLYTEKCTSITGTPTMFIDMLTEIRNKSLPLPSLRMALAAGAPCSPKLIMDMEKYLNTESVKALYGLSETTASVFQSVAGDSIDLVANSVGYIQDHVEVKVVDGDGKIVPFGGAGELFVRGYNNMICYWDEPGKTKMTLGEDGWLSTGDKFIINEDGYGRIVGRLKDIIIRGGENIAPKEIEDVLNTHPDIIDSQVVGVSDERLGEELCAVLRVRDGATVTPEIVKNHCTGHLAKFKVPRLLKFIDEFPKTTSGKIQKFKIKEMIESGKL